MELVSSVPVGGSAKTGAASMYRAVTAEHTSRTPTLVCTSETAAVSVLIMVRSWARAEEMDCRDACWVPGAAAVGNSFSGRGRVGNGPMPQLCHEFGDNPSPEGLSAAWLCTHGG